MRRYICMTVASVILALALAVCAGLGDDPAIIDGTGTAAATDGSTGEIGSAAVTESPGATAHAPYVPDTSDPTEAVQWFGLGLFPENDPDYDAKDYFDYVTLEPIPWREKICHPLLPGITLRRDGDGCNFYMTKDGTETTILDGSQGAAVSAYFCDITGDGSPELILQNEFGSGIIDERIGVYDFAAGEYYELADRPNSDYILELRDDGALKVTKYEHSNASFLTVGTLALVSGENGQALTLTNTEEFPFPHIDPTQTEPDSGGDPVVETNPVDTNPADTNPVGTNPADTNPAETNPVDTNPAGTNPVEFDKPTDSTAPNQITMYHNEELSEADYALLADCAFVGDSICSGLSYYGILDPNKVLAKGNIGVRSIFDYVFTVGGVDGNVLSGLRAINPKYVVFSMGMNDVNVTSSDQFCLNYYTLMQSVREILPDAKLFTASITPINASSLYCTNEWIDGYNESIKEFLADYPGWYYIDVSSAMKNELNALTDGYDSGDGIHLNKSTYMIYLRQVCDSLREIEANESGN